MNKYGKFLLCIILVLALGIFSTGCDTNLLSDTPMTVLEVAVEGEGNVNPEEGIHRFAEDSRVELIAEPVEGSRFVEWIGDGITQIDNEKTTIIMDKNRTVIARFDNLLDNEDADNGIDDENLADETKDSDKIGILIEVDIYGEVQDISVPFGTSEEDAIGNWLQK